MSSTSVSTCHTKVTCVVYLEAVVLIAAEVHITLFAFHGCFSLFEWVVLVWHAWVSSFVVLVSCIAHLTDMTFALTSHRPVVHSIQRVGHCLWLQCVVCQLGPSPCSDPQPVYEPGLAWMTKKSHFTTFSTLWLMACPSMTSIVQTGFLEFSFHLSVPFYALFKICSASSSGPVCPLHSCTWHRQPE